MHKYIVSLLYLLLTINFAFTQTKFEKGYFINNSDEVVNCLIKNERWSHNPANIAYKLNENGEIKYADVKELKEFKIGDEALYKRHTGDFPYYKAKVASKDWDPKIHTTTKTVFLKQLLTGKAKLFVLKDKNETSFAYGIDDGPITILLYGEYVSEGDRIKSNNAFKSQLYRDLSCRHNLEIMKVTYSKRSLMNYFTNYNRCMGSINKEDDNKIEKRKSILSLKLWAGMQYHKFGIALPTQTLWYNKLTPKFGVEVENVFPFNNNKWSLFLSAQYSSYKAEAKSTSEMELEASGLRESNFELKRLESFFGARHYMFLSNNSSLFLEGGSTVDLNFKNTLSGVGPFSGPLESRDTNFAFAIGVGYSQNQKLFLRLNYYFDQNLLVRVTANRNALSRSSLSLGYKF